MLDICIYKGACRQEHFLSERVLWAKRKGGCVRANGNLQGVGYKLCADEQEEACFLSIACVRMKFGGWAE